MKYAVISDLHSNLEAMTRVFEEIDSRKPDQVICLGDVVGYGANPSEVLKMVLDRCDETVLGNHDQAIEDIELRGYFTEWAKAAIEWTAPRLNEKEKKAIRGFSPIVIDKKNDVTWAHGSVHEIEEYHYLMDPGIAAQSFKKMETRFAFFGHTHIPTLFISNGEAKYLPAGGYQLEKNKRYLINPGSVGQPRDRNPKLSFAFFDTEALTLEIVRLDYDNKKAAEKIRKAGLPEYLADRLL